MKRLVLKESVKNVLITLVFIAVVTGGMILHVNRVEKISTGEITMQYKGE